MLTSTILFCVLLTFIVTNAVQGEDAYTPAELEALREFYPIAENLVTKEYEKSDIYLIHWLRARDLNVKSAADMLGKAMTWRKQNRVDAVLNDKEMSYAVNKMFPVAFGVAKDKNGRPAMQNWISRWDLRKGYLHRFDFSKLITYCFENISTMTFTSNHSQFQVIIDLNQFSRKQHGCLACFSFYIDYITQYENYYPNMARNHLVINTPRSFETILNLVKNLFSPHTAKTVKIFGVDKLEWQPAFLELFDANQLRRNFGGTNNRIYQG